MGSLACRRWGIRPLDDGGRWDGIPGGILVALIWPAGPHSGGLLAAFSPLVFVAADLVVWWILVYLAVLAFAKWFWHRHGGAMK
jgi:hypothetical protein